MELTKQEIVKITFADLMTGETVEVTGEPVPVTITIGDQTSGTLYFAPDSLAAITALASENGEAFRALFAPVKSANGSAGSRAENVKLGAYPWERRAFAATKGLADPAKGGVLSNDAEAAFAEAVANGSYTVVGTRKPPVAETAETATETATDSATETTRSRARAK